MRKTLKTLLGLTLVLSLGLAILPQVAAGGAKHVRAGAIWVDDELYGTVLTPNTLPSNAPAGSFDIIYSFDGSGLDGQRSIADAAPGDRDYNGGRWMVFAVTFTQLGKAIHDGDNDGVVDFELTNDADLMTHAGLGHFTISGPVKYFSCPLTPSP